MEQIIGNINNSKLANVNTIEVNSNVRPQKRDKVRRVMSNFMFIANSLLLIINVYYICCYYPNTIGLNLDYSGIVVGVLSVIVTILIGWQIFTNISIEHTLNEKIDHRYDLIKKDIEDIYDVTKRNAQNLIEETKVGLGDVKYISISTSLTQLGVSQYFNEDYPNSTRSLMNALILLQKINIHDELYDEVRDNVIKHIKLISKKIEGGEIIWESEEALDLFKEAALKTGDKDIIVFVMKFKVI